MRASVVIPTRNRSDQLEHTVRSLWRQTIGSSQFEIIVVDNVSSDDTPERVRQIAESSPVPVRYHRMEADRGPARSRNKGAGLAEAPYVAFVDSDVELDQNWLEIACRYLDSEQNVGLITGKLLYAKRPEFVNMFGGEMSPLGIGWDKHEGRPAAELRHPEQCLWSPTACVMLRRELFHEIGGFDEEFYFGFEDSDLGWRMSLAGWNCMSLPQLTALHHATPSGRTGGEEIVYHSSKNRLRSVLKNYSIVNLLKYVPLYLLYSITQIILKPQRKVRWRALHWNVAHWESTMQERKAVQRLRKVSDAELAGLFAPRLLPAQTLQARREAELKRITSLSL